MWLPMTWRPALESAGPASPASACRPLASCSGSGSGSCRPNAWGRCKQLANSGSRAAGRAGPPLPTHRTGHQLEGAAPRLLLGPRLLLRPVAAVRRDVERHHRGVQQRRSGPEGLGAEVRCPAGVLRPARAGGRLPPVEDVGLGGGRGGGGGARLQRAGRGSRLARRRPLGLAARAGHGRAAGLWLAGTAARREGPARCWRRRVQRAAPPLAGRGLVRRAQAHHVEQAVARPLLRPRAAHGGANPEVPSVGCGTEAQQRCAEPLRLGGCGCAGAGGQEVGPWRVP
jgi:hypothetical protein